MIDKQKNKNTSNRYPYVLIMLIIVLVLGGLLVVLFRTQPTESSDAIVLLTDTPTNNPPNSTPVCFWNWAYNDAPQQDVQTLNTIIESLGYTDYELTISAYGEDKICQVKGEVVSSDFYMMDISPTIQLRIDSESLSNSAELGTHIRQLTIAIIDADDSLSKINRITVEFTDGTDAVMWSAPFRDVEQAIADDVSGEVLFEIGQS